MTDIEKADFLSEVVAIVEAEISMSIEAYLHDRPSDAIAHGVEAARILAEIIEDSRSGAGPGDWPVIQAALEQFNVNLKRVIRYGLVPRVK